MLESSLKETAKDDNRIEFMDFQNQQLMPVVYRAADLFVLPSSGPGETWGLAMNEAMACGLPVVASGKAGGAVDLIKQHINGIVIDVNDTVAFENLLNQSFNGKEMLAKMGEESKKIVKDFSFEKIIDSLSSVMNRL